MAGNNFMSAPPMFTGENYQIWAVKMESYLQASDLWDVVTTEIPTLPEDPTIAQITENKSATRKGYKAKTCIHSAVSEMIFTKIMTCETAKQAWDLLKEEYRGNQRTKRMQILNLKREFEMKKMKEAESFKEYVDKLMAIVNKIRMLGEALPDSRVVEKILVTLLEMFEAKISSLEESRDLSTIALGELINAMQAQEQRRAYRQEEGVEGAFQAKYTATSESKGKKLWNRGGEDNVGKGTRNPPKFPHCQHCSKTNHHPTKCWKILECRSCKKKRHIAKFCKNKQQTQAQTVQQPNEE
ncbi:uncharacterized protein LOC127794683 [Diospyros lotus]|uniref:uncharacterized protein LOC127794683 n=1 Tax=Diospyros lotus TaxID=55363 RepID=UPI00224DF5B5|nr:uncharacterized protein LOC127794683 [Diospyros lotus]